MNALCAVGLHSFGDWSIVPKSAVPASDVNPPLPPLQTRTCQACHIVERRLWEREPRGPRDRFHDPYRDLHVDTDDQF